MAKLGFKVKELMGGIENGGSLTATQPKAQMV